MANNVTPEPDRDEPRNEITSLIDTALELADRHHFSRVGIYLSQAREALREPEHRRSGVGQPEGD